jgi:hypothetical protein
MPVRVLLTRAIQPLDAESPKTELWRVEARMLARQDECRDDAALGERASDGRELDCFGPGADHQPDVNAIQLSP